MTAMPTNTDPDRFDLLEMDNHHSTRTEEAPPDDAAERFGLLEIDAPPTTPVTRDEEADELLGALSEFGGEPRDEDGNRVLEQSELEQREGLEPVPEFLGDIASQAAANASTASGEFGSIRRVTADNAVAGVTNDGREHSDSGASLGIFERPAAERRFIVGPSADRVQEEVIRPGKLEAGQVVAGAVAEGHGVLVGWRGDRQITRAVLLDALRNIGREEWAPKPKDARAQAGRAMAAAGSSYHCKADRKSGAITRSEGAATGRHVWRLGRVDDMGAPGQAYGRTVAVMTLSPNGELGGNGDNAVVTAIVNDYTERCAQELYTSADLTSWLANTLVTHCGAVNYAVGWYIPARHREAATALCNAVSNTGWGSDWLGNITRPALPIATCDELRDGIARGLKDEVAQVLAKLHTERSAAAEEKQRRMADAQLVARADERDAAFQSAAKLAGDIGPQRAGTFLKELKAIATRVIAYSELLGDVRMGSARRAVHEAVCELEGLLDADNSGISQRFGLIFEELAEDMRKSGGVL